MINTAVIKVAQTLPREFRSPVVEALNNSDGTLSSFQAELASQTWDHPDLPVQDILDKLMAVA